MKNRGDYRYRVEDVLCTLSEGKSGWGKFVVRASYDDNPTNVGIRYLKHDEETDEFTIGKGISLTDEEADTLTETMVDNGYGDLEKLEASCKKRRSVYYPEDDSDGNS